MAETNDNTNLVIVEGNSSLQINSKNDKKQRRKEALADLGHEMLSAAIEGSSEVLAMYSRSVRLDGKPRKYRKE
tara:strand:- start:450 stop:671 length:222 start_codon:yes stop_codon:yes gene_type:complete